MWGSINVHFVVYWQLECGYKTSKHFLNFPRSNYGLLCYATLPIHSTLTHSIFSLPEQVSCLLSKHNIAYRREGDRKLFIRAKTKVCCSYRTSFDPSLERSQLEKQYSSTKLKTRTRSKTVPGNSNSLKLENNWLVPSLACKRSSTHFGSEKTLIFFCRTTFKGAHTHTVGFN